MPRLEEVVLYIRGIWLLLTGKPEAYNYLDISERGFWRSWWSLAYCLPPTLLSYVAYKMSIMAAGAKEDSFIYPKLAVMDYGSTFICIFIFFAVARIGGFGKYAAGIIIVLNWMNVPFTWAFSFVNLIQIYVPGSGSFVATLWLCYFMLSTFIFYQLISRLVGGKSLVVVAALLTLYVVPLLSQSRIAEALSIG